jgi:hypothetical protein
MFFAASLVGDFKSAQKGCTSGLKNLIIGPDDKPMAGASHSHAAAFCAPQPRLNAASLFSERHLDKTQGLRT